MPLSSARFVRNSRSSSRHTIISNVHHGKVIAEKEGIGARIVIPICTLSKVATSGACSHHVIKDADTKLGLAIEQIEQACISGIADAQLRPFQ